jgi:site-specific recombinase XerD
MASPNLTLSTPVPDDEFAKALTRYRNWLYARKGLAKGSVELHTGAVHRMMADTGICPDDSSLDAYLGKVRESGASYWHLRNTLMAIERYQESRGITVHFARPTKPEPLLENTLSEAEISVLLAGVKKLRAKALITVLAYSGIRNAEVCALRIEDIDLGDGQIKVRKGKGQHAYVASIPGACADILARYLRERNAPPDALAFVTVRHGHQLQTQDLRKIVRVAAGRAGTGKRVHPHLFRHSLAMNLLNRGAHIISIQKQLGHAYVDTTMLYLKHDFTRARHEYQLCAPSYL